MMRGVFTMRIAIQIKIQWKILVAILISTVCLLHGLAQPSWAICYVYDGMDRLTEAHYSTNCDHTNWIEYKYDQIGNLTDKISHLAVSANTITATAGAGGTISPAGATSVNNGGNQTFTIAHNTGYYINTVTVDGVSQGAGEGRGGQV